MNNSATSRRDFIKNLSYAGISIGLTENVQSLFGKKIARGKRVGIIGLDTSHSVEFTKMLNNPAAAPEFGGYKVVAAYPKGSNDIKSSFERIPGYTEEVKKYEVKIASSIKELLDLVDVVLLETNDGRVHLEQALAVFEAGKPVFIDKPVAGSLKDTIAIFAAAKQRQVPVFSSSSMRFFQDAKQIAQGKYGKVLGVDVHSPAHLEKTHPDLFWYGIHGIEIIYTLMGTGCKNVVRVASPGADIVVGAWLDGRLVNYRGLRSGKPGYGATVYAENNIVTLDNFPGYDPLVKEIVQFFDTRESPVDPKDTIEIYAFMEAADESRRQQGAPVSLESVMQKAV